MATRRERIIVVLTGIVILIFVVDRFVLTPLTVATAELRRQEESLQAELLANHNKLRKRRQLARDWRMWERDGLREDPSAAESQILDAVRSWARDAGIRMASIQPERPSQKGELREIRFQASASGRWGSLVRFLYLLETAKVPVHTQRLELRPVKANDPENLALNLRFSTLYRVAPEGESPASRGTGQAATRSSPDLTASRRVTPPEPSGT